MASATVIADALVRVKSILHRGGSMALPAALLATGGGLLAYRRATSEEYFGDDPLCHFIALIIVQMVPLVFLEVKILQHDDPVGIMYRFGTNVALMHVIFLAVRVALYSYTGTEGLIWPLWLLCLVFLAAVLVLVQGYKDSIDKNTLLWRMRDVWLLVGLAVVTSIVIESFALFTPNASAKRMCQMQSHDSTSRYFGCIVTRWWKYLSMVSFFHSVGNFIEILAFVPACLQIGRELKQKIRDDLSQPSCGADPNWAAFFFTFLIVLYSFEDIGTALLNISTEPFASGGHVLHFLLVLDFSIFFLGEMYDPAKLKARLMEWLPEAMQCSALV